MRKDSPWLGFSHLRVRVSSLLAAMIVTSARNQCSVDTYNRHDNKGVRHVTSHAGGGGGGGGATHILGVDEALEHGLVGRTGCQGEHKPAGQYLLHVFGVRKALQLYLDVMALGGQALVWHRDKEDKNQSNICSSVSYIYMGQCPAKSPL